MQPRILYRIFPAAFIGFITLALPQTSHAQVLEILVTDNLGHALTVMDGGANDSNSQANAVSIDSALGANFPNLLSRSNITASFDQPLGTTFRLSTTGDLFGATTSTITIISSFNGVIALSSGSLMLNDTNTIAFNNSPATNGTSTNGVHTGNVLFGQNLIDTPFSYTSSGGRPNSGAGMGPGFEFGNPGFFAVTSKTVIQVLPNGESQYTTTSLTYYAGDPFFPAVVPVPEPGSLALLTGLGVSSLFAIRRLRRRKK